MQREEDVKDRTAAGIRLRRLQNAQWPGAAQECPSIWLCGGPVPSELSGWISFLITLEFKMIVDWVSLGRATEHFPSYI